MNKSPFDIIKKGKALKFKALTYCFIVWCKKVNSIQCDYTLNFSIFQVRNRVLIIKFSVYNL